MKITIRVSILALALPMVVGCAASMAMVRSTYKDTAILQIGADRGAVIENLGTPDASATLKLGGYIDIYRIDPNAHSDFARRAAGSSHMILSVMSFGLWEFVGTPLELAARDRFLTYVLRYDASRKLLHITNEEVWKPSSLTDEDRQNCQQWAALKALDVASPQEPDPLRAIRSDLAANSERAEVHYRALHECLLRIYAGTLEP